MLKFSMLVLLFTFSIVVCVNEHSALAESPKHAEADSATTPSDVKAGTKKVRQVHMMLLGYGDETELDMLPAFCERVISELGVDAKCSYEAEKYTAPNSSKQNLYDNLARLTPGQKAYGGTVITIESTPTATNFDERVKESGLVLQAVEATWGCVADASCKWLKLGGGSAQYFVLRADKRKVRTPKKLKTSSDSQQQK